MISKKAITSKKAMSKESQFLKDFFVLQNNLTEVYIKFLNRVKDIIVPFQILRDEGKRFLSICEEDPKKASEIFEEYKSTLLKKYKV